MCEIKKLITGFKSNRGHKIVILGYEMNISKWIEILGLNPKSFRDYMKNHNLSIEETIQFYIKKRNITTEKIQKYADENIVVKTTVH